MISWLAQTQPGDQEADEEPPRPAVPAGTCDRRHLPGRSRGYAWPDLATAAAGAVRLRTGPAVVARRADLAAVVLTGYLEWKFTGAPRTIPEIIGWGLLGVLAYIVDPRSVWH